MALPLVSDDLFRRLAADPGVKNVWLGGSHARGDADEFSDIDLAVDADAAWQPACLSDLWVAGQTMAIGDRPFFHCVLADGTILDLLVTSSPWNGYVPVELPEPTKDDLPNHGDAAIEPAGPAVEFWMATHKDRKVLGRGLEAMIVFGLHHHRLPLLRLWMIADTGVDPGPAAFTIFGMTPIIRDHILPERRKLLGLPCRTKGEVIAAIHAYRDEVAKCGRLGLERYGVPYPFRLEAIVQAFPLDRPGDSD